MLPERTHVTPMCSQRRTPSIAPRCRRLSGGGGRGEAGQLLRDDGLAQRSCALRRHRAPRDLPRAA